MSLAIGKEGQNARLAARLTGYKIDIKSETQAKDAPDSVMRIIWMSSMSMMTASMSTLRKRAISRIIPRIGLAT